MQDIVQKTDKDICGRCFDEAEVYPTNCSEKPETCEGGMYHCPDCGAMLLAGVPHAHICRRCLDRQHPDFDVGEG